MIAKVLQPKNLYKAYREVRKNKGSAGIDRMSVEDLFSYKENNQAQIIKSILAHEYIPKAIKGVEIPKASGKTRLLGIPTVVDRWIQQAVSQILMTKFEMEFEAISFGFRPKKNTQQAVSQSLKYINDGYQDIVDIDLKAFFDNVDHSILLQLIYNKVKCRTTLRLVRKWLRAPMIINGKLTKRRMGIPQGSPISPLLSNIMLDVLDKELKSKGYRYVRYADDFSIYAESKETARTIGNEVFIFLRDKLKLPINRSKSGIRRPVNFVILGHGFVPIYKKGIKGQYQLVVKSGSWQNLKRKLKSITKKTIPTSLIDRLNRLIQVYRGWIDNFRMANIYTKLKKLDGWLRNRLRYCVWHDWKKPERKRINLIKLGIATGQAYAWSRTRMGGWAVAQSPILGTTITIARLKRKGYAPMLDFYKNKMQLSIW